MLRFAANKNISSICFTLKALQWSWGHNSCPSLGAFILKHLQEMLSFINTILKNKSEWPCFDSALLQEVVEGHHSLNKPKLVFLPGAPDPPGLPETPWTPFSPVGPWGPKPGDPGGPLSPGIPGEPGSPGSPRSPFTSREPCRTHISYDHGSIDRSIKVMDRLREGHLQKLLWDQEIQAVHHDRVDRPDRAGQVVRGSRCHPYLPSHRWLWWHRLGLPSLRGILEHLEDPRDPGEERRKKMLLLVFDD